MAKIATVSDAKDAAAVLAKFNHRLIRIEGFAGVGKTTIARQFADLVGAIHVEGDKFANKATEPTQYRDCIRQGAFEAAIRDAETAMFLILDAVCLDEIAPIEKWGRGFLVYVKRLSFNNCHAPTWHGGFDLEEEAPTKEPDRSIHLYHSSVRPHERADLILELPQEGHAIPNFTFSRVHCFDPV